MNAMRAGLRAAMLLGLLMVPAALSGTAGAQPYPPPVGSLTVGASPTTPSVGGTTTVSATILDNAGNPVAGADVVFSIQSQPGNDARFANGQTQIGAVTDANGVATALLSVGNTTGSIIVGIVSGAMSSQLTLQVQAAGAPPGVPPTGAQPEDGGGGPASWQAALIALGIAALLAGSLVAIRRRT